MTRWLVLSLAACTLVGCKHHFPLPYSTSQLVADSAKWPGEALVHYLGQSNADLESCNVAAGALQKLDEDLAEPFVTALEEGQLDPQRWQDCAHRLVPSIPAQLREFLLGKLAKVMLELLEKEDGAARLIAGHEALAVRPRESSPSLEALLHRLDTFDRAKLPPAIPPVFDTLVTTLQLDHGQFQGRALNTQDIEATQDDGLLLRMMARLPTDELRGASKHRLVRLRIERSDWPEVKARAVEVEAAVVATGRWTQQAASLELARPDPPVALPLMGLVKQSVGDQRVALLATGTEGAEVLPAIDLRAHLNFPVKWSRPLLLCRAPDVMSVEPCVDVKEVAFSGYGAVDANGVMHFPEGLTMDQAFELARSGEGLVETVRMNGKLVTSLMVPLKYLRPSSYFFQGEQGRQGPAVNVAVQSAPDVILLEAVSQTAERVKVIYPRDASPGFEFGSKGGHGFPGYDGSRGMDGSRGYDGYNAVCPSTSGTSGGHGGTGGPGQHGGDGTEGGAGGVVQVEMHGTAQDAALLRNVIRSRGGDGGRGGSGGQGGNGGSGGRGGSSTTCTANGQTQTLSGGSTGSRGSDGSRGRDGRRGADGPDGAVVWR